MVMLVILLLALCNQSECSKLNLPRVLLPLFKSLSTNFTLEVAGDGCFTWSSSRSEIIKITPLYDDPTYSCSSKAIVSTVSQKEMRQTAIITVEDSRTGHKLRADVILDVIESLEIVTTTRELYMEEPPELFEIRSYDSQGNEFTTLQGVEFEWNLLSGDNVLRFMTFRDSPYETPPSVSVFDDQGKQGHIVLLEGIRTGSAKVSVRLPHAEYRHVPATEVQLMVVANLIIEPSNAYIMKGDTIQFHLFQMRQGQCIELDLSPYKYYLESDNSSVALVMNNKVTGLDYGPVRLFLRDKNVASVRETESFPTAHLTVAVPSYLSISILPYDNWALIAGQSATILTSVFDRENHRFYLGENTNVQMKVPHETFITQLKTSNGSMIYGVCNNPGQAEILSELRVDEGVKIPIRLHARAMLTVFPKLFLHPETVVLPWYQTRMIRTFHFNASGGDKNYAWSSSNHSVATITQEGILHIIEKGQTLITLSMKINQNSKVTAKVYILYPAVLEIIEGANEAEVGIPIFINIALYGRTEINGIIAKLGFTRCQDLQFLVEVHSNFMYSEYLVEDPVKEACGVIGLIGKAYGVSSVHIRYQSEITLLEGRTSVAAHNPLRIMSPENGKKVVLSVGASRIIMFVGGPRPWLGKVFSYVQMTLKKRLTNGLGYRKVMEKQEFYAYEVKCFELGEYEFILNVKSVPVTTVTQGILTNVTVDVVCAVPGFVFLKAVVIPDCPESSSERAVAFPNSEFLVELIIQDYQGRMFDNATTFAMDWNFSVDFVIEVEDPGVVYLETTMQNEFSVPVKHYKKLITNMKKGLVTVQARVTGYSSSTSESKVFSVIGLEYFKSKQDNGGYSAEASLTVRIVDHMAVDPIIISLMNHPNNNGLLNILHGSGAYRLNIDPQYIANIEYDGLRTIKVKPLKQGNGVVSVVDLCLPEPSFKVDIKILNVGNIYIAIPDKIPKDKQVTAIIKILSTDNKPVPLPIWDNEFQNEFVVEIGSLEIIKFELQKVSHADRANGVLRYLVTGLAVGDTSIRAKWMGITSGRSTVQVFSPIRLHPRNLTLIIGSEYHLRTKGGPIPDIGLQFIVSDPNIVTVVGGSHIKGLHLGQTVVTVVANGPQSQIYSKDSVEVNVISLTGVWIHAPTIQLCIGCIMPIWASGIPQTVTPLILGSVLPPFEFKWSVSGPGTIQLFDIFHESGIKVSSTDKISMRLKGLKAGKTSVFLRVLCKHHERSSPISYNASLEIEIVKELSWISPVERKSSLLLAPNSVYQLETNKDINYHLHYTVLNYPVVQERQKEHTKALTKHVEILTLTSPGLLSSSFALGNALVIGKAVQDQLKEQIIGLHVEVKQVHYMMINIVSKLEQTVMLPALPKGMLLAVNVTYHDNIGRVFDAAPSSFELEMNPHDKIQLSYGRSNNTVSVSLEHSGSTVLHLIESSSKDMEDYIKIPVENAVSPTRIYFTVGEIICFSIPLGTSEIRWSSDSDAIEMKSSGIAFAHKVGSAVLTYATNKHVVPYIASTTAVEVLPVYGIQFDREKVQTLTNSWVGQKFNISVFLINEKNKRESNLYNNFSPCTKSYYSPPEFPFTCEIRFNSPNTASDLLSIFSVVPEFNTDRGAFMCEIMVLSGPSLNTSLIESNITLRIKLESNHSESVVLPFIPGIYISSYSLHFATPSCSAHFVVYGLLDIIDKISIDVSDKTVITVIEDNVSYEKYSRSFTVILEQILYLKPDQHKDLRLFVISPLSNQTIEINVVPVLLVDASGNLPCILLKAEEWWYQIADFMYTYRSTISFFLLLVSIVLFFNYFIMFWTRPPRPRAGNEASNLSPYLPHESICQQWMDRRWLPPVNIGHLFRLRGNNEVVYGAANLRRRRIIQIQD